jgi:large subunit ribosomal protein L18e
MAVRRRKENPELLRTVVELRKAAKAHAAPVWLAVAERLERPRHQRVPMNVGHLERIASVGETVAVAGKLLAEGRLAKRLTVAAFGFSAGARGKIVAAGGAAMSLQDLIRAHPDGAGVRLLA